MQASAHVRLILKEFEKNVFRATSVQAANGQQEEAEQ
jgi:hypothetical protein